jgi:hypothetical protein
MDSWTAEGYSRRHNSPEVQEIFREADANVANSKL